MREILRDARTKKGLRQAELASNLGVPQSFVSKYESGERVLTFVEAVVILDELGLSPQKAANTIRSMLNETKS
ncbi:MAG: helix-turn-helix transcriptional regulator [Verrucomicrobiaceae bacterium]|nr:helix-turn-helix transcriptional regulator [Verrucomicrobiaceae bacterium]